MFCITIRHFASFPLAALPLALMLGCSVGPNFKPPAPDVPSTWNAQEVVTPELSSRTVAEPMTLVDWWRSFKDPTLNSLVHLAVETNPDIRQAEARIRQARAARGVAVAGFFPEINSQAFFERSQGSSATVGPGGTPVVTSLRRFSGSCFR